MKDNINSPALNVVHSWLDLDQHIVKNMPKKHRMQHLLKQLAVWSYPQERIAKLGQATELDRENAEFRREIRHRNRLFFKILTLAVSGVITAGSAHVAVKTLVPGPISLPLTMVVGGVSAFFLDQLMVIMMKKGRMRKIRQEELDALKAKADGNDLAKAYYEAKIEIVMDVESQDSQTSSFLDSAIAVGGILFEAGVVGMLLIPSGPVGIAVGLCFPIVFSYCGARFDEEHFRIPETKEVISHSNKNC